MDHGPLSARIIDGFGAMSAQLQTAGRYVLDRPRDVALLSMREQARQAGVQPATMTRLAKHLGMDGYEELRAEYAAAARVGGLGFARGAGAQITRQKLTGDKALAAEMLKSISAQIDRLAGDESLESIAAAAKKLASARHIYCLGLRSIHSVVWHLHYILSLIGERTIHLDAVAGTGADRLARADRRDVLLVASVAPYSRLTVELAEYAAGRRIPVVAITDSAVAPIAKAAAHTLIAPTDSPSFFHAVSPAFAIAEVLGAIIAGRGGAKALAELHQTDRHLAALNTHLRPRQARRAP